MANKVDPDHFWCYDYHPSQQLWYHVMSGWFRVNTDKAFLQEKSDLGL